MKKNHLLILLFSILILNSCSKDDDSPIDIPEENATYESGIIVLNEGNFGSPNASVSFIGTDGTVQPSIFKTENELDLGDTAQSIKLYEDLAFIVLNVSNKIEIVNRYTFKSVATIDTNLMNPRYAEIVGNSVYVTNWGDAMDSEDDYVAVFNLEDFQFVKTIPVKEGPEKILTNGDKLYVANQGGYSFNHIISVINASSNSVAMTIEVGDVPNSMVINGESLYVLNGGKPSYAETETASSISKIDLSTDTVEKTWSIDLNAGHAANLSENSGSFYYSIASEVYEWDGEADLPVASSFSVEEPASIYGFDIYNDNLYISSPTSDFTGNGDVYQYDLSGNLLNQYLVGINPNGVYFN